MGFDRYDRNQIAGEIEWRNRGSNFDFDRLRKTNEYEEIKDLYYEFTMSGDREEAMAWLNHWMDKSWAWKSRVSEWETFFLAAYDIYKDLEGNTEEYDE